MGGEDCRAMAEATLPAAAQGKDTRVIRSILLALVLVSTLLVAQAQAAVEHRLSVSTGLGFASSIGEDNFATSGFLWQVDAEYFLTESIAAAVYMQVIPVDGATLFNFAVDGRYHFKPVADKIRPYVGFGFGVAHAGFDFTDFSVNGALFAFAVGGEYDLTERLALTSDMRFNFVAGDSYTDSFFFTWQMIGARFRF